MTELTAAAQRALNLMDLTTLNDDDTDEKVIALCRQANSPAGHTAAICIYPRFIPVARKALREQGTPDIRIATVTNFPHGNDDIDIALAETRAAIAYGADEVTWCSLPRADRRQRTGRLRAGETVQAGLSGGQRAAESDHRNR